MFEGKKRETIVERGERKGQEEVAAKAIVEKREAFTKRLKTSIDDLLKTDSGRTLFTHLYHVCGYAQADVPLDKLGQVENGLLLYNATRRAIYINLRGLATKELLLPVELEAEKLAQLNAETAHKGEDQNG